MEIPDVIVVNKSDHPLTDTMIREIRGVLSLGAAAGWRVPIVKTEAARGEGVEELIEQLEAHRAHLEAEGTLLERRRRNLRSEVIAICAHRMRRRLEEALRGRGVRTRCSTRSSRAGSTRRARRRPCSSASTPRRRPPTPAASRG
jgi:putative protein kinase ArgK-like GTPase of G3E family